MRQLKLSRTFKRDIKRLSRIEKKLHQLLELVIDSLQAGKPLEMRWLDHSLGSGWPDHRDLHLKPDLLLVYTCLCPNSVKLVCIGNHANLQLS